MNKDILTSHILDSDLRQEVKKVLDIYEAAERSHVTKNTKFLTPNQIKLIEDILYAYRGINYKSFSLNPNAERQIIYFFQDYIDFEEIESAISILKVSSNTKENTLSHRDFLGSILALGIERDHIGDILAGEDGAAYIIVLKTIDQYLLYNLDKVKNESVTTEIVEALPKIKTNYEELIINVATIRIDAVIARLLGLSREKAQDLVSSGRVYINYLESKDKALSLEKGTVISVRGYGKFRFNEILAETKKNRLKVKFLKYLN